MSEGKAPTALVSAQHAELARRATEALAKRGLDDLESQESAEAWFQKAKELYNAAPKNCSVAQFRASLGEFFQCLQRAATLNPQHPVVQLWLGTAYRDGLGTEVDLVAASSWIRKAALQGVAEAQYGLAEMLKYERGERQNLAEAVEFYRKAAEQDHIGAQFRAQVLLAPMARGQPTTSLNQHSGFFVPQNRVQISGRFS